MRHQKDGRKLGRTASHRKAMFRNLVTSFLEKEKVETTPAKAKEARRIAEKIITLGKRGDLHARREALRVIRDKKVVSKVFGQLAERFATRPGGYTRIYLSGFRKGDAAPLAILELLPEESSSKTKESKSKGKTAAKGKKKE